MTGGSTRRGKCRRGWLVMIVLVVALGVLALGGKFLIIPGLVQSRIKKHLARCWDGSIRIGEIEFNYTAPMYLREISLLDSENRVWVRIGSVEMELTDWGSLDPVLRRVHADTVRIDLHFDNGKCRLPFRLSALSERIELTALSVRDLAVSLGEGGHPPLIHNLTATGRLTGTEKVTLTAEDVKGDVCGGTLTGRVSGSWNTGAIDTPPTFHADLTLRDAHLPELQQALTSRKDIQSGLVSGRLEVHGAGTDPDEITGKGVVVVRNADLGSPPAAKKFFRVLGIELKNLAGGTDIIADFSLRGPMVLIDRGQIGNKISVLEVEPGGVVDLRTRQVDAYLVVAVLKDVEELFAAVPIPMLQLTTTLSQKLSRVHVKGRWPDPPEKLIHPAPLEKVQDSTVHLIRGIIHSGGALPANVGNALGNLLDAIKDAGKTRDTPRKEPP